MFKYLCGTFMVLFSFSAHLYADSVVEAALIEKGDYTFSGTFGPYDFSPLGDESAFDWAFTTSSGLSYQLQGDKPSDDDVFGWKEVDITVPEPSWYMFSLGADVDADGSEKFDWVLLSTNRENPSAYKLAGESDNGTFLYSDKLGVNYSVNGNFVNIFTSALDTFSLDIIQHGNNLKQVSFDYDKDFNIQSAAYYDVSGNVTWKQSYHYAKGLITSIDYDYDGNSIVDNTVNQTFDSDGHVIQNHSTNSDTLRDITYEFNNKGMVTKKSVLFSIGGSEDISFTYDDQGRIVKSVLQRFDGMIRILQYQYDASGNISIELHDGDSNTRSSFSPIYDGTVRDVSFTLVLNGFNILALTPAQQAQLFYFLLFSVSNTSFLGMPLMP